MSKFRFTYICADSNAEVVVARLKVIVAESEGEAQEIFDEWANGLDDYIDVISVKEDEV